MPTNNLPSTWASICVKKASDWAAQKALHSSLLPAALWVLPSCWVHSLLLYQGTCPYFIAIYLSMKCLFPVFFNILQIDLVFQRWDWIPNNPKTFPCYPSLFCFVLNSYGTFCISFYLTFWSFIIYFICTSVLPTCMSVHHMHVWSLQRYEADVGAPGTGIRDGCESRYMCLEIEPKSSGDVGVISY